MKQPKRTVYLDDIGECPAKRAGELQPGDIIIFNHGNTYKVHEILETTSITVRVVLESPEGEIVAPNWRKNSLKAIRAA